MIGEYNCLCKLEIITSVIELNLVHGANGKAWWNSNTLKYSTYASIDPKKGEEIELKNGRTYIICYGTIGSDNVYNIGISLVLSRAYNNVKGSVLSISSVNGVEISLDGNILKVNTTAWLRLTINML